MLYGYASAGYVADVHMTDRKQNGNVKTIQIFIQPSSFCKNMVSERRIVYEYSISVMLGRVNNIISILKNKNKYLILLCI